MRLDLFTENDSVLLLGEGNFSFSVCLHKLKLPIKITATCFESEIQLEHQLENIQYLKSKEVPVFLNVDATKLHENDNFSGMKFSKILFNFPHVGGKMKIHLNRQLLKGIFESCREIIAENGNVIISLCQGQGGTPCDQPQRQWENSWQVTDMAAHGNFVLTGVEPFHPENFKGYKSVGYRSQDVGFNLDGALVHVFVKREPPPTFLSQDALKERLALVPLDKKSSSTLVPVIYSELYEKNPLQNENSCICFLKNFLIMHSSKLKWRVLNETDIPVHVDSVSGVSCEVHSKPFSLRFCPLNSIQAILQTSKESYSKNKLTLFPGMYFNPNLEDFKRSAPITFHFTVLGENLPSLINQFLNSLISLFEEQDLTRISHHSDSSNAESRKFLYQDTKTGTSFVAAYICSPGDRAAIINAQRICEHFFHVGWREIWAEGQKVQSVGKPILKHISLYPSVYKFDITLRYTKPYKESDFCRILWLAAGQLIECAETVNEYTSKERWSSRCYRLTYRSLDKPLHRSRVIHIHSNIVGRMLELGLNVSVA